MAIAAPTVDCTISVMLRWWNGRTTAYRYEPERDGALALELTYDRGDSVGHFRFKRMQDGVFVFTQVH